MTTVIAQESKWHWDDLKADYEAGRTSWREVSQKDYWHNAEWAFPAGFEKGDDFCAFLSGEPYTHETTGEHPLGEEISVAVVSFTACGDRFFARLVPNGQFQNLVADLVQTQRAGALKQWPAELNA